MKSRKLAPASLYRACIRAACESLEGRRLLAGLVVNSTADNATSGDGLVTLREAITAANSDTSTDLGQTGSGADTITFTLGPGTHTINLAGPLPIPSTDMSISGPGADVLTVRRDTGGAYSIFRIADADVVMSRMTIANGAAVAGLTFGGGIDVATGTLDLSDCKVTGNTGCGIYNAGSLTVTRCTVSDNTASSGGAIGNGGQLTVVDSTFTGNHATGPGGAIISSGVQSAISIDSSTFHANQAGSGGSGSWGSAIYVNSVGAKLTNCTITGNAGLGFCTGAIYNVKDLLIEHCTIAGNSVQFSSAMGGIHSIDTLQLNNNIVALNNAGGNPADVYSDTLNTNGFNFIGTDSGNPMLGPLANNGGPTQTMALLPGSPCLNAGEPDSTNAPDFDQRGLHRAAALRSDLGAYEAQRVVDNSGDVSDGNHSPGNLTLREAIELSNAAAGPDGIGFDPAVFGPGQMINLTAPLPELTTDMSIGGPGPDKLTVRWQSGVNFVIFIVTGSAHPTVTLSGMTITNANTAPDSGRGVLNSEGQLSITRCDVTGNVGGGIRSSGGTLTVADSVIRNNSSSVDAGGIVNAGGSAKVVGSTISQNSGSSASGIRSSGTLEILDSTIADNVGVGVLNVGQTLTVINSTLADNDAVAIRNLGGNVNVFVSTISGNNSLGLTAGGIHNVGGAVLVYNSIVAQNIGGDIVGAADTTDHNFIGGNPMLGPLADNGGPTKTMALLAGSPCINAGDPFFSGALDFDQRGPGHPRIHGYTVDIGAYEFGPFNESLVVTTTGDENNGTSDASYGNGTSLREAISWANIHDGPDTITFALDPGTHTINLTGELPHISTDMDLMGPGRSVLTVRRDSGGDYGIFSIDSGYVTLSGLTITNGMAPYGGGISNFGNLTVTGCAIINNAASVPGGSGHGGGILNTGELFLTDCTISGNSAESGAGIYNEGLSFASLNNCIITNNTAGVDGGGVHSFGVVALTDCTISGNTAGVQFTGGGGGIYNGGGSLNILRCTISGNQCSGAGGGIHNFNHGTAAITDSSISDNHCDAGGIGPAGGGGIFSYLFSTLTVTGCTINGNSTGREGGGIWQSGPFNLSNSTLYDNTAANAGGGLFYSFVGGGDNFVRQCTISGNRVTGTGQFVRGGGINIPGGSLDIGNTIVSLNTAANDPDISSGYTGAYNFVGGNPMLGALADNGGPTQTMKLLAGSPCINTGDPDFSAPAPAYDQRGFPFRRIEGGRVDIGAFELDATPPQVVSSQFEFNTPRQALRYAFDEEVSASLDVSDLELENLTTGSTIPTANMALVPDQFLARTFRITFPGYPFGALPDGNYRATLVASGVTDPSGNPLATNHVITFFFMNGDANRDRSVDVADFSILASRFNLPGTFSQGNFNYNGGTEIGDFSILASRFNTALPGSAARSRTSETTATQSPFEGRTHSSLRSPAGMFHDELIDPRADTALELLEI